MRAFVLTVVLVLVGALAYAEYPGERMQSNPFLIAPDGGRIQQRGSASGATYTKDPGCALNTNRCWSVVAGAYGDGGMLGAPPDGGTGSMLQAGQSYTLTVDTSSPVRILNGSSCGSYEGAGYAGAQVNEGSVLNWPALAAPDGGAPLYSVCAKTATATSPRVEICERVCGQ